jgi:tetratricopeptide (TPR) repeat protein
VRNQGRGAEAVECFSRALETANRLFGTQSSAAAQILGNLAVVRQDIEDFAGAERALRDLLAVENPRVVRPINRLIFQGNLAAILERQDKLAEAARTFLAVFAAARGVLPEEHWILGAFHKGYGVCLMKQKAFATAETEIQLGIRILSKSFAADHARVKKARAALGDLYEAWGKPDAAAAIRAQLAPEGGVDK